MRYYLNRSRSDPPFAIATGVDVVPDRWRAVRRTFVDRSLGGGSFTAVGRTQAMELDSSLPRSLGAVHRGISVAHDLNGGASVASDRNADAGAHPDRLPFIQFDGAFDLVQVDRCVNWGPEKSQAYVRSLTCKTMLEPSPTSFNSI